MSSQPTTYRNTALTFGVEIEICVASLNPGFDDPHPTAAPTFRALDRYLNHPSVPEHYPRCEPAGYRSWCVQLRIADVLEKAGFPAVTERETTMSSKCTGNERLSRWIMTDDASIDVPLGDDKYTWYRIELNSPAFYFNQAAVEQVKCVCALLARTFRIHINDSMGLHVHVGDGNRGFEPNILRTIMALLFVFEPQLSTLHPKNRRKNIYCRSLNEKSKLGRQSGFDELVNPKPKTRSELLEKLLRLRNKREILDEMSPLPHDHRTHRLAYNLSNMRGISPTPKRTIEFRQHESTLDPDLVANWICTCVGLVEIPFRETHKSIESLLRIHVNESVEEFDVVKVLLALNLTSQAEFYDARFHATWIHNDKHLAAEKSESSGSEYDEMQDSDDERSDSTVIERWMDNVAEDKGKKLSEEYESDEVCEIDW